MRRSEKEITDRKEIDSIMKRALVCRIALVDSGSPYLIPVNFVVYDGHLYFHSAQEGKKLEILKKNNQVCFEIEDAVEIVRGESACSWGTKYLSIIGFGRALLIEETEAKKKVLNLLMEKYAGKNDCAYKQEILNKLIVVDVAIENITGKKSGY
jgi:uncharacterized protein